MHASHPAITRLDQASDLTVDLVGAKARNLSILRRAGLAVPDGLVVTVDGAVHDPSMGVHLAALGPGPFAVRSSGTAEDGSSRSQAGRYDTDLDVSLDQVVDVAHRCRTAAASLDGPDAPPIALLVQPMVAARVAGVAFTADPVTGDRRTTVVTGVTGLGDRLVGGQVDGDEWEAVGRRVRRRRGDGSLDRTVVRRVLQTCEAVSGVIDGPLDIEWAWDGDRVWVLQARPITGLPPEVDWTPPAKGVYSRTFRFGEWISEPVSTSFEDWALTRMEARLHALHRETFGQIAPLPHHVVVNGWYFYSLNFLPVPGASARRSLPHILRKALADPRRVSVMLPPTARFGFRLHEEEWRADLLPRYRLAAADAASRVESATPAELLGLVDELADLAGEYFAAVTVVAGSAYKVESELGALWQRHLRDLAESHVVLLQGLGPTAPPPDVPPDIESLDWIHPSITDAPGIRIDPNREAMATRRVATTEAAIARLAPKPRRQRTFLRLLADAQHLAPVREAQVRELPRPWPVMRRAVMRLGEHLQAAGLLEEAADVFHLRRMEIAAAAEAAELAPVGERAGTDLRAVVSGRRAARSAALALVPPMMIGRVPLMVRVMFKQTGLRMGATHSERALLQGVPASPGRATGPVRLIRGTADFDRFQDGDVLVAPLTTPAWTPLLARASAVVTDIGSGLAHASIVARELGVPAVVGTGDATARLHDGQLVTVDGARGTVEALVDPSRTSG